MEGENGVMRNRNLIFAGVFVLLGILLALAPLALFPVCEHEGLRMRLASGKEVPMKCFWTARAELGLAILLVANGILLTLFSKTGDGRTAAGMAAAIGVVVILVPSVLIGTCMNPQMPCNVGTKPALLFLGVLVIAAGGLGLYMLKPKV